MLIKKKTFCIAIAASRDMLAARSFLLCVDCKHVQQKSGTK
jgi:hypothetical protein